MNKRATKAQAKLILWLWSTDRTLTSIPGQFATNDVLVCNDWVVPTGEVRTYPSGQTGFTYKLSQAGLVAASEFLSRVKIP